MTELPAVSGRCALDAGGLLTGSLRVPADALPGARKIVACSPTCEGANTQRTATITVLAVPVRVPRLRNQVYPEVVATLDAVGLLLDEGSPAPRDATATVVGQDPSAGTEVDRGSSVSVTFAVQSPAKTLTVPNLVGLNRKEALVAVAADALVLAVDPAGTPKGHVQRQGPKAGARVDRGATVTVLLVPTDKVLVVAVPDVVGRTDRRARDAVERAGLILRVNEVRHGAVESQDPPAGTLVRKGSIVGVQLVAVVVPPPPSPEPGQSRWWLVALGSVAFVIGAVASAVARRVRRRGPRWVGHHVGVQTYDVEPTYDAEGDPPEHTVQLVPDQGESRIEVMEVRP